MESALSTRDKERLLAGYLRERARGTSGSLYVKSKFIAEEIDLSPREIGACLHRLQDTDQQLEIEQWSYTNATTWRVTLD